MRIDGLPVHPVTVHFPVALLTTSVLWDGIGLWTGTSLWWALSFYTLAAGLIASVPTLMTGFVEYARLSPDAPSQVTATRHLLLTGSAVCLFLASLLIRSSPDEPAGAQLLGALSCSGVGLLLLTIGGHLGARLVYQFGVGQETSPQE